MNETEYVDPEEGKKLEQEAIDSVIGAFHIGNPELED